MRLRGVACGSATLVFCLAAATVTHAQTSPMNSRQSAARRDAWFLRGRVAGRSTAALRYRAYQQKISMRAARRYQGENSPQNSSAIWTSLGPAPLASDASGQGIQDYGYVSGRATAVAVDPADATGNTVYLGGAEGGLWQSGNALSSSLANVIWTPLIDNQATLAVGAIGVQAQPGGPSLLLVGTGEINDSTDSYYGLGILRSADGGNNWTLIPSDVSGFYPFGGLGFSQFAFGTANPNLVVAAVATTPEGTLEGLTEAPANNLGLYYSTDDGNSWNFASIQDSGVTITPDSATSVVYNSTTQSFYAVLRNHGFYSSSDGINWSRMPTQPGNGLTTGACPAVEVSPSACPIFRGQLTIVPGRNEMYAWYVDVNDNDQGIWQSTDSGAAWAQINDSGIVNCGDDLGCGTEYGTYNLMLTAVPNGQATDLYAGAVNLFKCTVSSVFPSCNGTGTNSFLNLTHVYGCPPQLGSIAHVHPSQHAAAFMLTNSNQQDVMYFANDGGVYRALNAYTDLTSGTCGQNNQFDDLNQTLGSMTQIVSFSQSATDSEVILAGAQANGSPATQSVPTSTPWSNVNGGDGGYNQIDPSNECTTAACNWFVSNPPDAVSGVNIFDCILEVNCVSSDFENDQVVSSATLGGDIGPYYPPFILDPQSSGEMIVGTCRVWRGPSTGGMFILLSNNFEFGGDGSCLGTETNMVRAIAAGGAIDQNRFSNVIYAGTDGYGPLIPTSPTGGHIWVSTNIEGGLPTWADRTGSIDPSNFPISSIAIDPSDPTGLTAYAGIMGFNVSHVWQTTNGGATWTDFTGNLPDAPVNAILIDPGATTSLSTIYLGTDAGVFSGSGAAPGWSEVGPAPDGGPNQSAGYLPNVPVTALGIFNSQGTKLLRASTYGRGIWQYPLITTPDFVFSGLSSSATIFGGQSAAFSGELIALNGYNSNVDLSCVKGSTAPPPKCAVQPSSLQPTPTGQNAGFTLTGSGPDGNYFFNLQGSDASGLSHDFALALHVVDFNLTALSSSSVVVADQSTSSPITFQVTAAGSFSGTVNLACDGLPAGATCNFLPSSSADPTSSNPVAVSLTISTTANAPLGTYPITISASSPGAPAPKTRALTLVVAAGFSVTSNTNTQSVNPGSTATYKLGISPLGTATFQNEVIYTCASGLPALALCSFTPASPIASGSTTTSVTLNITTTAPVSPSLGTPPGAYTISADFSSGVINQTFPLTLTVNSPTQSKFTFKITPVSGPQSVAPGQTANFNLELQPLSASEFPQNVTLACTGAPSSSTCQFTPPQVGAGSGRTGVVFSVVTTPATSLLREQLRSKQSLCIWAMFLAPLGLICDSRRRRVRLKTAQLFFALVFLLLAGLLFACGGQGLMGNTTSSPTPQPGTLAGTYPITITATTGSATATAPVELIVQ